MKITVDDSYLVALLKEVEKTTNQTVAKSLTVGAGVLCRMMDKFTWPKTQQEGEGAIITQVRRVFATPEKISRDLNREKKGMGKKFYGLMKRGLSLRAIDILRASKLPYKDIPFGTLDPKVHQQSRNSRGRVTRKQPAMGLEGSGKSELKAYVKKKAFLAGLTKAGWFKCLKIIGGRNAEAENESGKSMPVFAKYVTRHKGRAGGTVHFNFSGTRQFIQAVNTTPWASEATDSGAEAFAKNVARNRFVKYLETRLKMALQRKGGRRG